MFENYRKNVTKLDKLKSEMKTITKSEKMEVDNRNDDVPDVDGMLCNLVWGVINLETPWDTLLNEM